MELSRIIEAKKQIRLEIWAEMYREYRRSGKTTKEWCEGTPE